MLIPFGNAPGLQREMRKKWLVGIGSGCEVVGIDAGGSVTVLDESVMGMTLAHGVPSSNGSNSVRFGTEVIQLPIRSRTLILPRESGASAPS